MKLEIIPNYDCEKFMNVAFRQLGFNIPGWNNDDFENFPDSFYKHLLKHKIWSVEN